MENQEEIQPTEQEKIQIIEHLRPAVRELLRGVEKMTPADDPMEIVVALNEITYAARLLLPPSERALIITLPAEVVHAGL